MEPRLLLDGNPVITELLADNSVPWYADNPDSDWDWIEIHNPTTSAIDLTGWHLTDDNTDYEKWTFPSTALQGGGYLVVFASGLGSDPAHPTDLHTNFGLSKGGDYIALVKPPETPGDDPVVVSEFDFPQQEEDVSYGLYEETDETALVPTSAPAKVLIPSYDIGLGWTLPGYSDASWMGGPGYETGIGYETEVSGFAVYNYHANVTVGNLSAADGVIATPSQQAGVFSENPGVINYYNTDSRGHYVGDLTFPGLIINTDANNYVVKAEGILSIPTAGLWTFGVNSDDGFRLTITGATTTAVTNSDTAAGGDSISWANQRGTADTLGVFNFPSAGDYNVRLVFYECTGGSSVELWAAQGSRSAWNSADFDLVGDTANGGLAVRSQPVSGGGGSGSYGSLVSFDVETQMKGVNASAYIRIPFVVENPADYNYLALRMKYDDGFVAYLNGVEVARRNAPGGRPAYNAAATAEHPNALAVVDEEINISDYLYALQANTNILAIHGLNADAADGDFLILPVLADVEFHGTAPHYFATPSPGEPNRGAFIAFVDDTQFTADRGFYDMPFQVSITCDTPDATIYYTTDGSAPSETNGAVFDPAHPLNIMTTTMLRAVALRAGWRPSNIDTQTYIFLDDILDQPSDPAGFPATWGATAADYEMDPAIVYNPLYSATLKDDLRSIPTMSLVMDPDDLFGTSGIYSNPTGEGLAYERPGSIEMFYPAGYEATDDGFQLTCAVRMYGGVGRYPQFKKHAFRLLFKGDYGPTKLRYPLFGEDAADSFDTIILRHNFNDGYVWGGAASQYIRDEYVRQLQLALGDPSAHGTFVHLYVNGLYWGLYNPTERPDQAFAATYFGGEKEEWDAINAGEPTGESSMASWNTMIGLVRQGLETQEKYQRIQGNNPDGTNNPAYQCYLDVKNYINYLLVNFFTGNSDWPSHNWYAARRRVDSTGFKFFAWDSEWVVHMNSDLNRNMTGATGSVAEPYTALRQNAEFKVLFGDMAQKAFFNGGPFYVDPAHRQYDPAHPEWNRPATLYAELAGLVEQAIVGESARWGDVVSGSPYTPQQWENERDYILNTYMTQRSGIVLQQLRNIGLYPSANATAPTFYVNGVYQHGGDILRDDILTMTAPAGTIYYTTDGTDPRQVGGGISPTAIPYAAAHTFDNSVHVKARVYNNNEWSALNEATFLLDLAQYVRITEIMYNPGAPTAAEIAAGYSDNDEFEFIEIRNIGADVLDLENLRFSDGITFTFPAMTIDPGDYALVVKNQAAFQARYGAGLNGLIAGEFFEATSLRNGGEGILFEGPVGGVIHQFDYKDGWYDHTDGGGFSLVPRDPLQDLALWDVREGWRPSGAYNGSPGAEDIGFNPDTVIVTEVLTHTDASPVGDWIELHNTSADSINIGGWFLSDDPLELDKYQIAADTWIGGGAYLAFTQFGNFGIGSGDPGVRVGFGLSELGEAVYLSSQAPDSTVGGYREIQPFGAAEREVTFGLYTKSTGGTDFVAMTAPTFEGLNAAPAIGPVVINEIMYNPATGDEFIELKNLTGSTVQLYDPAHPENTWKFTNGIDFSFPEGATIPANAYALVVPIDPAVFRSTYMVNPAVRIYGPWTGVLDNGGATVELSKPGAPELVETSPGVWEEIIPYIRAERVTYNDKLPWPTRADGGGSALMRLVAGNYGNDVANWGPSTTSGTPGAPNQGLDPTPPSYVRNVTAVAVGNDEIALGWWPAVDPQSGVSCYHVYRDNLVVAEPTTTGYRDTGVALSQTYTYQVAAVNKDGVEGARSLPAVTIRIVGMTSVRTQDETSVVVTFSETVTPATAEDAGHYQVTCNEGADQVGIASAVLQPDGVNVLLTLASPLDDGIAYALTVNGVVAQAGTPVTPNAQKTFGFVVAGSGTIYREYWTGIAGSTVSSLTAHPNFPDNPTGADEIPTFEVPGWGDNYGQRLRGYVHPAVSDNYTFWIASDDNSQLWLSTDDDPANALPICSVPGWTDVRQWNKFTEQRSASITLEAGRRYYIEAIQKEGTAGDNLAVAWTRPGESPVTNGPITSQFLSPYLPVPNVTVSIHATDPDAAEEGSAPGTFTISRNNTDDTITVYYMLGGTAGSADYQPALSGQVEMPAGVAAVLITITPVDDFEIEPDQTVILTLLKDAHYLIGATGAAVTIADNDSIPPVVSGVVLNGHALRSVGAIEPSGIGVRWIDVTFSEPVTFAPGDVLVHQVAFDEVTGEEILGDVLTPTNLTGSGTAAMRIEFDATTVVDTWVKVILKGDGTLENATGVDLDGDPNPAGSGAGYLHAPADLPTGDGVPGGDAVFYVGSLRGDMWGAGFPDPVPDGEITVWDINGFTSKYQTSDPDADLWGEGFWDPMPEGAVTAWDINAFTTFYRDAMSGGVHLAELPTGGGPLSAAEPAPVVLEPESVANKTGPVVPSTEGYTEPGAPAPSLPELLSSDVLGVGLTVEADGLQSRASAAYALPSTEAAAEAVLSPDGGVVDLLALPAIGVPLA